MGGDRYDAIVVGAGPAGSTAALIMAQNNLSVALLERGDYPGSKNMFGGTIYSLPTQEIIPAFWQDAPLERPVVADELWFVDRDSAVKIGFTGLKFAKPPFNKFTVLRPKFDDWLAHKAVEAGAKLVTNALVVDLVYERIGLTVKKVDGVILDSGDVIYADVVVLAEGAPAHLVQKAGMRGPIEANSITLYVKEILEMPSGTIEERFNLEKGHGTNIAFVGDPTSGVVGKAGIWTNKDSISLIAGGYLNQLIKKGLNPYQLLERTKQHPIIKRLLDGAKPVEYMASIIPKGGYKSIPQLYGYGILVAGDAAMMISGRQGTDLAMLTGKYAALTITQAKAKGSFSPDILDAYERRVRGSYFMKDIIAHKNTKNYYDKYPDADYLITKMLNDAAYEYFKTSLESSREKNSKIIKQIRNFQSPGKTINDIYHGIRNWGVF